MRRSWIAGALVIGAAIAVVADTSPEFQVPVTRAVLLVAGVIAAVIVFVRTASMTASAPERFEGALTGTSAPAPDMDVFRTIDFTLRMATVHPLGVEWLRPLLRDLAAWTLMRKRGVDMERQPEAARNALGEPLWRLIGPAGAGSAHRPGRAPGESGRDPRPVDAQAVTMSEEKLQVHQLRVWRNGRQRGGRDEVRVTLRELNASLDRLERL